MAACCLAHQLLLLLRPLWPSLALLPLLLAALLLVAVLRLAHQLLL